VRVIRVGIEVHEQQLGTSRDAQRLALDLAPGLQVHEIRIGAWTAIL